MFEKRIIELTKEQNVKLLEQIRIIRRKIDMNLTEIEILNKEIKMKKAKNLGFPEEDSVKCGESE